MIGKEIYDFCSKIFPICRSITGEGNRKTLSMIKDVIPELQITEVPSGTKVSDWIVPQEWKINEAYIESLSGQRIIDFKNNNLHVISYSASINKIVKRSDLETHLYTDPLDPDSIPYVTSYYNENWGFCLTENQKSTMTEEFYKIVIDSDHFDGSLTYGDLLIKGKSDKEIIISTYICHPSMANNECSGPSVATFLARWLKDRENFYSYRFIFAPETIGAICFISRNIEHIRKNVIAGINLTCVGDNNNFSLLTTRRANTRLDKIARKAITDYTSNYKEFDFKSRGSDERQYSHPNIDIPMISIMRSKYGTFSEYHTSKDNMNFVSPEGFEGSFNVNKNLIEIIENNKIYLTKFFGEPMMSKRKLVPDSWMTRRTKTEKDTSIINYKKIFDTIFECDGSSDLVDIANKFDFKFEEILDIITKLKEQGIIENDSDIDYSCKDWFKKT